MKFRNIFYCKYKLVFYIYKIDFKLCFMLNANNNHGSV